MIGIPTSTIASQDQALLAEFTEYLRHERALASTTVENYLNQVRPFVRWHAACTPHPMTAVKIQDVNAFLTWRARSCSPGSIMVAATGVRALLRWMFTTGVLGQDLAAAVGPVRYSAYADLATALPVEDLAALLDAPMSTRDRAVLFLLARLALRSREVAELRLEDIDWRAGELRVTGKANDCQLMPLSAEVGQHLVNYLRQGRDQASAYREVFLTAAVPHRPLRRSGVSEIVSRLARRVGLSGRVGAHQLRHSAATAVLSGGGTLAEAGQLLRHRSMATTSIYAKAAPEALAALIRPWPAMPEVGSGGESA